MSWTRNKYHYAVRKAKHLEETIKSKELMEAAELGDINLMKDMRKTLSKKTDAQQVPDCLDGKVTHDRILERFKDYYEELYNSASTEAAMTLIKSNQEELMRDNEDASNKQVDKITGEVVKKACGRMLPGKTDVTKSYTSDVFLHAPDFLFKHLGTVFRSYLTHGTVTIQILSCAFLPLFMRDL